MHYVVSVPLRGLWFLSLARQACLYQHGREFPSPCGDYGSYHGMAQKDCQYHWQEVSVPLRGLWFLSNNYQ